MTGHSKEPWRVQHPHAGMRGWEIADSSGLNQVSQDVTEANARRIVACVNACAGWETSQLEAMELGSLKESLVRVMQQRDELLAAMERLLKWHDDIYGDKCDYSGDHPLAVARAGIARAKGGAVTTKPTGETE